MIERIIRYWQWGRFYQFLNHPLKSHHLPTNNGNDWFAPIVFEKFDQIIVPLWLPTTLDSLKQRLPYIPAYLFDPLGQFHLFTEPLHAFDQCLRFELMNASGEDAVRDVQDLSQRCMVLLDVLSDGKWQQTLIDKGFQRIEREIKLSEDVFFENGSFGDINSLQQQFAQCSDEESYLSPIDLMEEKNNLSNEGWTVFSYTRGDPEQNRHIEKLRRTLLSEDKTIVLLRWNVRQSCENLWQAQPESNMQVNKKPLKKWRRLQNMIACDVLIIVDAERFLPQSIFPYLGQAQSAIFIGDPQAITSSPLLTGYQETVLLEQNDLADDECQEEIQHRGMAIGTGNALRVAMTHSLYGIKNDSAYAGTKAVSATQVYFVDFPGKSTQNGSNPLQAVGLIAWVNQQIRAGLFNVQDIQIVTLFSAQQQLLQHILQAERWTCPVVTLAEMPAKRVKHIIFSSVYNQSDARPFLLDVGESLWHQLQAGASEALWIVGEKAIFDPTCHSPSGKIAKRWLEATCIYSN